MWCKHTQGCLRAQLNLTFMWVMCYASVWNNCSRKIWYNTWRQRWGLRLVLKHHFDVIFSIKYCVSKACHTKPHMPHSKDRLCDNCCCDSLWNLIKCFFSKIQACVTNFGMKEEKNCIIIKSKEKHWPLPLPRVVLSLGWFVWWLLPM